MLVAIVVLVAWWLLGRTQRVAQKREPGARDPAALEMVVCAHCGVHLPRGDAKGEGELMYCGEEHRRLGPRSP
jgi:uncharacterized protein